MSAFMPVPASAVDPDADHPVLRQRPLSPAEARSRWEVRAAQWRAVALAELIFGSVTDVGVSGFRSDGPIRGLLRLAVPFAEIGAHRARQARFLAAAAADPILSRVPFVYVIGPDVED